MNDNFLIPTDAANATYSSEKGGNSAFAEMLEAYWRGFRRHIIAVAAFIIGAVVLAVIFTLLATPQYTAVSRIEISRESANITQVEGLETEQKNQDLEFYQTQYALLTARSVAERVAKRLQVVSSDALFEAYDFDIEGAIKAKSDGAQRAKRTAQIRLDLASDLLLSNVAVRPVAGSSLVDIAYRSPSRELSTTIANVWVDEFLAATVDRRFESTSDAQRYLEDRLGELRQRLEDSQRQLVAYAADKEIITLSTDRDNDGNTESSETLRSRNLRALNDALAGATTQRVAAQSQAQNSGSANQNSLSNIALNSMRDNRSRVSAELARQKTIFEPAYPSVQALQAQLAELDRGIRTEENRIRQAAQSSYREAASREDELQRQVNVLKRDTVNEQRDSIQYAIYQREVDTNRELYEGLLQRYKEIGVAGVGANNISVVDEAVIPDEPTSPNLLLNLALGLLAGLGLAAAYVFVREQLDQSIKDPTDVTEIFGLPLLGAIPDDDTGQVAENLADIKSTLSEAYFSTVSNLSFLTPAGAPRSMAITSTRPNEGKSTTAFALALAFSRIGKRTIIVDCDLRNPSQHDYFGIAQAKGMTNLLSSGGDLSQVEELCVPTGRPNLDFMQAGPPPPNPGALLSNELLIEIIKLLMTKYDHVIVDGPPMLGLADAPLMSKAVDGVIYTVEANGVKIRAIQTGLKRLGLADARILGAVVTKLNSSNSAYGYGYGYGYGYDYGSSDKKQ